jgi:hypothetical protein
VRLDAPVEGSGDGVGGHADDGRRRRRLVRRRERDHGVVVDEEQRGVLHARPPSCRGRHKLDLGALPRPDAHRRRPAQPGQAGR